MGNIKIDRIQKKDELVFNTVEDGKDKNKQDQYSLLMMVLLDAFTNHLHLTDVQSKMERENAACQEKLISKMEEFHLVELPADAWGYVPVYKYVGGGVDPKGNPRPPEKVLDHYDYRVVNPEKYNPILMFNQQQLQLSQGIQLSVSVLKQTGQLTVNSASSSLKQATETSSIRKDLLGTMTNVVRTIANKMRQ